jgi:N-acetylglucosamine kinase-like BadF-type ATPase
VATRILKDAAGELSTLVVSVARQLRLMPEQYDLVLAGGILTHVELVRDGLQAQLARRLPPHEVRIIAVPAEAAARRALQIGDKAN